MSLQEAQEYWNDFSARLAADDSHSIITHLFAQSSAVIKELRFSNKESDPLRSIIIQKEVPLAYHQDIREENILTSKARLELSDEVLSFPLTMGMGTLGNIDYLRMRRYHWPTAQEYVKKYPKQLFAIDALIEEQSKKLRDFFIRQDYVQLSKHDYKNILLTPYTQEAYNELTEGVRFGVDEFVPCLDNHPNQWLVHPNGTKLMRLDVANKGMRLHCEDVVNETLYSTVLTSKNEAQNFIDAKLTRYASRKNIDSHDVWWSWLNMLFLRSQRLATVWGQRPHQKKDVENLLHFAYDNFTIHKNDFNQRKNKLLENYARQSQRVASF